MYPQSTTNENQGLVKNIIFSHCMHLAKLSTMKQAVYFPFLIFFVFLIIRCTTTSAQSPAESPAGPAPSGPIHIIAILKKAGHFTTFIRLLKNTDMAEQINGQLKKSNIGRTIFAPPDSGFSDLKLGTLNSLSDREQLQLVQFHIIPSFLSVLQLQTATNPVHTVAGDSNEGDFQLNITSSSTQVNLTTGVVNATIDDTLFTESGRLAVYQVDHVLLPLKLFGSASLAPPPSKPEKDDGTNTTASVSSGVVDPNRQVTAAILVGVAAAVVFSLWL
jgi:uncharacterized surface protein with fasciclin (FAS1) repeats